MFCFFLGEERKGEDITYKVHSLANTMGRIYGAALIVSAQLPTPEMVGRIESMGYAIVGPNNLNKLGQYIQQWMNTGFLPKDINAKTQTQKPRKKQNMKKRRKSNVIHHKKSKPR